MKKASKTLSLHLQKITALVQRLEECEGEMPHVETDLLLSELRQMYDIVLFGACEKDIHPETKVLESDTVQSNVSDLPLSPLMVDTDVTPVYAVDEKEKEQTVASSNMPTVEEIEGNPNEELFEEEKFESVVEPEPEPEPEPTPEPTPELAHEPTPEPTPEPAATSKTQSEAPTLFDYIKKGSQEQPTSRTIADSLGANAKSAGIETTIQSNKVADLRTVININDKFSFMNELFHNNMKGYNDFILRLNAISSREEALSYVESISKQYNWDNESIAVKTFYNIFDRKF